MNITHFMGTRLGGGVYLWEYAPYRTLEWARLIALQRGGRPAAVAAAIRLGNCVNLIDRLNHNNCFCIT